ncbi:DUF4124 domain-containing protein [Undibacterium terreum]|uniref:DUF4124 domain-containing protein n=1 Tax=Undibacterium terreum TaxID=1224302 RepID=A0A916UC02_9BURK|nr:DUF4124 domain-containing protein [Undibacterium terreum]GGC67465.1 hypothetical protein GCM10011396_13080 [Undibacterium terreum]
MNKPVSFHGLAFAIACSSLLMSSSSFAGVNKCTDAAGVVTYSDQPCQAKEGLKTAEVKNSQAFAAIAAREDDKKIAQTCRALADRRSRCRISVDYMLNTAFTTNCEGPLKRDASDQMRDQRLNMRRDRYNRVYRDRDDADNTDKSEASLQCESLQSNMWKFVKEKFSPAMRPEDIKAIDYRLAAVNPDRRETYNGKIRHTGD